MTTLTPEAPTVIPTCPECGGHEFKLYATRNVRAYVTFAPDGSHDMDDVKHDDLEWDGSTLAECLGCRTTDTLDALEGAGETPPPAQPATPPGRVWEASAEWQGQKGPLGLHATPEGALLACLEHAIQRSDGQPPAHTGMLRWRLWGPFALPIVVGRWEDLFLAVEARAVLNTTL